MEKSYREGGKGESGIYRDRDGKGVTRSKVMMELRQKIGEAVEVEGGLKMQGVPAVVVVVLHKLHRSINAYLGRTTLRSESRPLSCVFHVLIMIVS